MELKTIEMQIALPKSIDANKQTQEIQQRGILQNENATLQMEKETQAKRKNVIKNERKDHVFVKKDQSNQAFNQNGKKKQKKKCKDEHHPYKGNNLDFSG
ncbi:hypothetical protein J6TS2_00610 [Heyndrickxia sporothermodurans]|nr:hypothetical protein J6TS2_00610 [Heyndrickxia sporothermodurans]